MWATCYGWIRWTMNDSPGYINRAEVLFRDRLREDERRLADRPADPAAAFRPSAGADRGRVQPGQLRARPGRLDVAAAAPRGVVALRRRGLAPGAWCLVSVPVLVSGACGASCCYLPGFGARPFGPGPGIDTPSSPSQRATGPTGFGAIVGTSGRGVPPPTHADARGRKTRPPTTHNHASGGTAVGSPGAREKGYCQLSDDARQAAERRNAGHDLVGGPSQVSHCALSAIAARRRAVALSSRDTPAALRGPRSGRPPAGWWSGGGRRR